MGSAFRLRRPPASSPQWISSRRCWRVSPSPGRPATELGVGPSSAEPGDKCCCAHVWVAHLALGRQLHLMCGRRAGTQRRRLRPWQRSQSRVGRTRRGLLQHVRNSSPQGLPSWEQARGSSCGVLNICMCGMYGMCVHVRKCACRGTTRGSCARSGSPGIFGQRKARVCDLRVCIISPVSCGTGWWRGYMRMARSMEAWRARVTWKHHMRLAVSPPCQ